MRRSAQIAVAATALALLCVAPLATDACVFLFGTAPERTNDTTPAWNHAFAGDDWTDSSWSCASGHKQSPISVTPRSRTYQRLPSKRLLTRWRYGAWVSNGSNIEVWNSGHTIQVQWPGVTWPTATAIVVPEAADDTTTVTALLNITSRAPSVKRVRATPLQFHFHARSEHTIDGEYFPLELHIVHTVSQADVPGCPASGCYTVTGIMLRVIDGPDNPHLKTILDVASGVRNTKVYLPAGAVVDLDRLILDPSQYVTYEGSLTTPPCSEGLLWHVLLKPSFISVRQLRQYNLLVAAKSCTGVPEEYEHSSGEPHHHHHRHLAAHDHTHHLDHDHAHAHDHADDGHAHHHHHHAHHRLMLAEDEASSAVLPQFEPQGPYNCTPAAYGENYRMVQELNGRVVKRSF